MIKKLFSLFSISRHTFEGEKSYETVVALLYRHWFVLVSKLLAYVFLLFLPSVVWIFINPYLINFGLDDVFWFLVSVYMFIWWLSLFYALTMYFLDTWIVTDHRILDNEQHGFFNRSVSELHLSRIQDISVKIVGPIQTFLDFGYLEIQTAGTEPKFFFKNISHPNKVRDEIMRAQGKYISEHLNDVEIHEER